MSGRASGESGAETTTTGSTDPTVTRGDRSPVGGTGEPGTDRVTFGIAGVVAGLFVLSMAAAAYEIGPASVLPVIRESLQIGPTAAGWLMSVMFATAVVASIPVGIALDRVSVRWSITAGAMILLLAGVWGWMAAVGGAFMSLLASRVVGGLGFVVIWNAGADLIATIVPAHRRATIVGIFTASGPVGFAVGQLGSPLIAGPFGWPAIFPIYAGMGIVGLGLFLLASRVIDVSIQTETPGLTALVELFVNRQAWTLYGLGFVGFSVYLFLNTWLPSYLTEGLGHPLAISGLMAALFPAVGILARPTGGAVSDRLFGGRRRPVVLVAFTVLTVVMFAFPAVTDIGWIVGFVTIAGLAVQVVIGLLFSYIAEVVAPAVTSTAIASLTSVGLLGAFLSPILAGEIIARADYATAFLLAGALTAGGSLLAWWAPDVR